MPVITIRLLRMRISRNAATAGFAARGYAGAHDNVRATASFASPKNIGAE